MTEKTEKDIILFDDSNSYSFCYFYSGTFNQKDLELKLSELYNKKFGENARFSYKITQKIGDKVWFASVGCNGKDLVSDKINFPSSYFVAAVISRKYKDEYIFVIVEESSSFTVFLCYNEPIYSSKIGNKLLAISSEIGKEIPKMSEIFSNASGTKLNVNKLIFYGSLSKEQIGLINIPGINKKIKEEELDYTLFDSPLDLNSSNHFINSATTAEAIPEINNQAPKGSIPSQEKINEIPANDNKMGGSSNFISAPEIEISTSSPQVSRTRTINFGNNKLISTIATALIIGGAFFPLTIFSIKAMDFYTYKINSNIDVLNNSSISELPASLLKEVENKTTYLNSLTQFKDYKSDMDNNIIDKILFRDPLVKINSFSAVSGVYDLKIEVNSEKDFLNYLSNILFSDRFVLDGVPSEILPEKTYEIKVIPIPIS